MSQQTHMGETPAESQGKTRGFTASQRQLLESLDAVSHVDARGNIHYTKEFSKHAIEEYKRGKGPKQIFAEAGFPLEIMGYKRIERAMYRWRHAYDTPICVPRENMFI